LSARTDKRTFILDEGGTVRAIVKTDSLGTAREFDEYVEALTAL
jgi:alkyl hydroperoxide reductase subunit AhpC